MAYSRALRDLLDPAVMPWEGVDARVMFGCHAYFVYGKLFLIVLEDALVLKPAPGDEAELALAFGAVPWAPPPRRSFGRFRSLPAGEDFALEAFVPYARRACESRRKERS